MKVVTKPGADRERGKVLPFAWRVAKHVRSNAIVDRARDLATVGVGAGGR